MTNATGVDGAGASRSIAKNTVLLTLGLLSGRILGIFLIRKMTPILGTGGMGIWGAAIDISAILQVVTNFGLGTLLTREITRAKVLTLPLLASALLIRTAIGALCYLLLLAYVDVSGFEPLARSATLIIGLAIFIESASMACDAVLQAHDRVQYQAMGQIVSAAAYLVLGWVWLDQGHGLMGVIWANLVSRFVRLGVMVPLMLRYTGPWRWRDPDGGTVPGVRWLLGLGWPLFLSTTFGILYNKVDTVMLKEMVGDSAAGIYVLGHRALDMMIVLPGLFGTALFPAMARYGLATAADAVRLGERSLRYMMAVMTPLTLLLAFLAGPIIRWFDPSPAFADSVLVFMIVIWGLPLQAANTIFNRLLITAGRERVFVNIGLACMLLNVVLNSLWIPRYGYYGASVATIVSMTLSTLLHIRYLARSAYLPALRRSLLGPAAATAIAWGVVMLAANAAAPSWGTGWDGLPLEHGWLPFLACLAGMAGLYGAALVLLRILDGQDLRLLVAMLKPAKS